MACNGFLFLEIVIISYFSLNYSRRSSEDSICHMSQSFSYHETFLLFFMSVKLMSAQLGEGVLSISVSTVELRKASQGEQS